MTRVRNKEEMREYQKRYRANMTEEQKEQERKRWREYANANRKKKNEYNKIWYSNNKNKSKEYYQDNREHIRNRVSKNSERWRLNFFEMYGKQCECCGESILVFLTIDHIKGQKGIPYSKKERGIDSYRNACKEYRPDLYRTFCMNCNFATRYDGSICPHQK